MKVSTRNLIYECKKCNDLGIDFTESRIQNYNFAYSYKPEFIKLLWIVESPPFSDPPRYFYRPELTKHDSLFREIMKVLNITITNPKHKSLEEFMNRGNFLIDSAKCPVDKKNAHLKPIMMTYCSDILIQEIIELNPDKIILIKSNIYSHVLQVVNQAEKENPEIKIVERIMNDKLIPFPGSGQQKRFQNEVTKHLNVN